MKVLNSLLVATALCAAGKQWTLDGILGLTTAGDVQLTADGSSIAYVTRSYNAAGNRYDSYIWVASADGSLTSKLREGHGSDHHPRWSPDGRSLAFLSRREGRSQIYILDVAGQRLRKLTSSPSGVTEFRWTSDGKRIGYLAVDPPSAEEETRRRLGDDAIVAESAYKYARVYSVPALGGDAVTLTKQNRHVVSFDWSPDGSRIAYAAQPSPRGPDDFTIDIYEVELKSGAERSLVSLEGRDYEPTYSHDGKQIAFHSQGGNANFFAKQQIGVVPSGGGAVRFVTEAFSGDVFRGGTQIWWSPDNRRIVFAAGQRTKDSIYELDVASGKAEAVALSVTGPPGNFSMSADGKRMAILKSFVDRPSDVYLSSREGNSWTDRQISHLNPQVAQFPAMKTEVRKWRSKDGMEIEGVLRLPPGYARGQKVPLLVEIHGGPTGVALESYPINRTYPTQLLLQQGFAVLAPNFRGSANYGEKLRLANIQSQGFGDYDDVMTGVDSLIAAGIADPERLGVMGWSYGGFLTTWIIGHTNRFKAASIGGSGNDWINTYSTNQRPRVIVETYFGGRPWDSWEKYQKHSPRFHLRNVRTPALLLRGQLDVDGCQETFTALQDLKVPVELVSYPREGHGIAEPMHQKDLMRRNVEWFTRWIPGPHPNPAATDPQPRIHTKQRGPERR